MHSEAPRASGGVSTRSRFRPFSLVRHLLLLTGARHDFPPAATDWVMLAVELGFASLALLMFTRVVRKLLRRGSAFFRSAWNWLDLIVVVFGWIELLPIEGLPTRSLRLFRALRPLRSGRPLLRWAATCQDLRPRGRPVNFKRPEVAESLPDDSQARRALVVQRIEQGIPNPQM